LKITDTPAKSLMAMWYCLVYSWEELGFKIKSPPPVVIRKKKERNIPLL